MSNANERPTIKEAGKCRTGSAKCRRRSTASSSAASRSPPSWTASLSATGCIRISAATPRPTRCKALARANHIDTDRYRASVHADPGQHRQGAGAVRHRQRRARPPSTSSLKGRLPPGELVARIGQSRLQAGGRRRGRAHARPSRPYRRPDRRRQAGVSQGALRVRRGRVRFLEASGENVREARKFNRELLREDLRAARRPRRPSSSRATRWCRASARSTPSGIRPACWLSRSRARASVMINWADTCDAVRDVAAAAGLASRRRRRQGQGGGHAASASSTWLATDGLFVAGFHMPFPGTRLGGASGPAAIAGCRTVIS